MLAQFRPCSNCTRFNSVQQALIRAMLAGKVGGTSELGVTPWNEVEVNDGDEVISEDFGEVIDDEIGAVRAQAFIVQGQ